MKCIKTVSGAILPIRNIAIISRSGNIPKVWTSANGDLNDEGYILEEEEYNKLLNELEML